MQRTHPAIRIRELLSKRYYEAQQKLMPGLLFKAVFVGMLTGVIGMLFRVSVDRLVRAREILSLSVQPIAVLGWLVPTVLSALMVAGTFLIMRRVAPETGGSGIPQIEGYLDGLLPIRWLPVLLIKYLGGLLALGSGMVLGREGPTIQMGGSVGKAVGDCTKTTTEQIRVLVSAGAGAGLTAAFNAPLAGILFVIEEMRPEFQDRISSIRAVTLASIMASVVIRTFQGQGSSMKMSLLAAPPLRSYWAFVVLGVCLGFIGYLFNIFLIRSLDWFSSRRGISFSLTGLYVGAAIGFVGWLYPVLSGGGDGTIFWAFNTEEPGYILFAVFLARFGLTMFSYGSGAPGGIFAPMLALATSFSLAFAQQAHSWFQLPGSLPAPDVLAVAGMGALVAATVRAPLTAVMLTAEMTGNYLLILPLLLTCVTSTVTAHALGGEPIYSVLLERRMSRVPQST